MTNYLKHNLLTPTDVRDSRVSLCYFCRRRYTSILCGFLPFVV